MKTSNNSQRRSHALLGQFVLKHVTSYKHSSVEFFVNPLEHSLKDWKQVGIDTFNISKDIKLPDDFQDWVDDDNLCYDNNEDLGEDKLFCD